MMTFFIQYYFIWSSSKLQNFIYNLLDNIALNIDYCIDLPRNSRRNLPKNFFFFKSDP